MAFFSRQPSGPAPPTGATADLYAALRDVLSSSDSPLGFESLDARVRELLAAYCASEAADWQQYVSFGAQHYLRHAVSYDDTLELVLIAWGSGQGSRVHSHQNSHCWMTALSGSVVETRYAVQDEDVDMASPRSAQPPNLPGVLASVQPCPALVPGLVTQLHPGETAYISDAVALHAVRCADDVPAGSVTLHVYAPPIRRTKLYEPDDDRVTLRQPGYFSVGGVVV